MTMTEYTSGTYERVTFKPEDARARSVFLTGVTESELFVMGYEVNRAGEHVGDLTVSRRLHVIDKGLVRARIPHRLSLHYGELEVVS